ncbi:MAG: precorrin-4 C(11)-methyltransferase [bacterium]
MTETATENRHPVTFVGAGPGDPELLTVRGRTVLEEADLIVYAGSLVPEAVTAYAPDNCEKISSASLTLDEIMERVEEAYTSGERIVRLHSGDPSIYGAVQEQMGELDERDIAYAVVPGVSSFAAAAAALRTELTIPDDVQTIVLSRASGRAETPESESLEKLAETQSTLCVFLSAKHARKVQNQLLEHFDPSTPAAICYKVSRPEEKIIVTELEDLAAQVSEEGFKRTTLFLVGDAIQARTDSQSGVYDPDHKHVFRPE